jgi:hypothetical protein
MGETCHEETSSRHFGELFSGRLRNAGNDDAKG